MIFVIRNVLRMHQKYNQPHFKTKQMKQTMSMPLIKRRITSKLFINLINFFVQWMFSSSYHHLNLCCYHLLILLYQYWMPGKKIDRWRLISQVTNLLFRLVYFETDYTHHLWLTTSLCFFYGICFHNIPW